MECCVFCDAEGILTAAAYMVQDQDAREWPACADCFRLHHRARVLGRVGPLDRYLRDQIKVNALNGRAYHFCRV